MKNTFLKLFVSIFMVATTQISFSQSNSIKSFTEDFEKKEAQRTAKGKVLQ